MRKECRVARYACSLGALTLVFAAPAHAMHIAEGILPAKWAGLWWVVALPFVALGLRQLRKTGQTAPQFKAMIGLVGAAVFIISCMPIPVPTAGTCSHPCGTGLAAIFIGPLLTVVVASVALLLQALFLAHGGLTTLGGNLLSMGIIGGFVGYGAFRFSRKIGASLVVAAFLAGVLSDWATYATTSFELASALHGTIPLGKALVALMIGFVPTQLPLGILEGLLTAGAVQFVTNRRPELIKGAGL
jgi:cobalt/nickel transport system permease protein